MFVYETDARTKSGTSVFAESSGVEVAGTTLSSKPLLNSASLIDFASRLVDEKVTMHNMLNLHLQEPDLKWIGLNVGGWRISIRINGIEIKGGGHAPDWCMGQTHIYRWINVRDHYPTIKNNGGYTVSFCHSYPANWLQDNPATPYLSFLIGVMIKEDKSTMH